jgi:hypothetical protein
VVGTRDSGRLSGRTRYCNRTYTVPPPADLSAFVDTIIGLCASERVDAVVPLADETLGALLDGRPEEAHWKIVGPQQAVFDRIVDKAQLAELAAPEGDATALADRIGGHSVGRSAAIAMEISLGVPLPRRVIEPMDVLDPLPTVAMFRAWLSSGLPRETVE